MFWLMNHVFVSLRCQKENRLANDVFRIKKIIFTPMHFIWSIEVPLSEEGGVL